MKTAIAVSLILAAGVAHADTLTPLHQPSAPAAARPVKQTRCMPEKFVEDEFYGECVFISAAPIVGKYVQPGYAKYAALWRHNGSVILGAEECSAPQHLGVYADCPQPDWTAGSLVLIDGAWYHDDGFNSLGQELVNNLYTGYFWSP